MTERQRFKIATYVNQETKQEFIDYCQQNNIKESDVIKELINEFLKRKPKINNKPPPAVALDNRVEIKFHLDKDIHQQYKAIAHFQNTTLSKVLRYSLTAAISNNTFNDAELKAINNLRKELNIIGRNINQIAKRNTSLNDDDREYLSFLLYQLESQDDAIKKVINHTLTRVNFKD